MKLMKNYDNRPILTKEDRIEKVAYFAIPITKEEVEELKLIKADFNKEFKGINTSKILLIGYPLGTTDLKLVKYVENRHLENLWHNVDTYFWAGPLEYQKKNPLYEKMGTYRYLVQTNISPTVWFMELARFFDTKYILIYKEESKLKDIKYEYRKPNTLLDDNYRRKY